MTKNNNYYWYCYRKGPNEIIILCKYSAARFNFCIRLVKITQLKCSNFILKDYGEI